jgi:N-acylneuraminate cytidylyltransferase
MSNIAIITARGGSKRLPRKNIKNFLGKPIIQYAIDAALQSGSFDEVMVSTDDAEIAEISEKLGASVPFLRSPATSDDFATTSDVLMEVLNNYKGNGKEFEMFCCIYPTAPFVTAEKLHAAITLLEESDADGVLPVTRFSYPILRSLKVDNGKVLMNWPEYLNTRSQDLAPAFHDCGQFYVMRSERFLEKKKILTDHIIPYEIPESEVQDIDNEEDWKIAEIKYSFLLDRINQKITNV